MLNKAADYPVGDEFARIQEVSNSVVYQPGKIMKPTGHATESLRVSRPELLKSLPEVVVYENHDYGGHHKRTNLNMQVVGSDLNDKISSIIVVLGKWRFYRDPNFLGDYWDLDVGYYPSIGIASDVISSFQCIEYAC